MSSGCLLWQSWLEADFFGCPEVTTEYDESLHFSRCTEAILEPVIFLVLVQVTGCCWQLCGPNPAICFPICHHFHSLA